MAEQTFLEAIGIFQYFGLQYLLVPLLIFVMTLGILQKTKMISDKPDINAAIGFSFAFVIAMVPQFVDFLAFLMPLMIGFIMILFGIGMIFMLFGAKSDNFFNFFKSPGIIILTIVIFMIIVFYSISDVFGDQISSWTSDNRTTGGMGSGVERIFSPEVFGTVIFISVAAVGVYMISAQKS